MAKNTKTRDFLSGTITKSHEGGKAKREKPRRPAMRAIASLFAAAALMATTAFTVPAMAQEQNNAPVAITATQQAESQAVVEVTADSFQKEVVDASNDQLVIFIIYGGDEDSQRFANALEKAAKAAPEGSVRVAKMNVDDPQNGLFAVLGLGVQNIPSTLIISHGYVLKGVAGAPSAGQEDAVAKNWVEAAPEVHKNVGDQIEAQKKEQQKPATQFKQTGPKTMLN